MPGNEPFAIFRLIAPEFSGTSDDDVDMWISLTRPLVSKRRFGSVYGQALALLAAHRMSLGGAHGEDPLADIGKIGVGGLMRVTDYSEGETSVGFNSDMSQYAQADAELTLTPYGVQYLTLRRKCIVPIISAGDANGGA